ncbi:hypothetical protein LSTR_LSTR008042 [Laodelphax striatellus]|uniref:Uncharacterized protein n=1 Tax=Laodelphax striatellus TaxID=195883 RepID=A0A482XMK2_LAOST|nr:hypothetical protein LSTR_LSTR008042 [Laodelphax striatellus]
MLMKISKLHIITVILFLYYIKSTSGTKKLIDHPNYNEIISSISYSNPNSKICRHLKLKAASKLTDKPYETDNVIQSQLKSNSYDDRILVKNRPPPSNNLRKRSTDPLKIIELSSSFPQLIVNNTAENEWINTSTGTFQTFANMFNRIDVPSADIIEKDIDKDVEKDADLSSSYFIGIPSNSTSCNADDADVLSVDSSSSFNEASENNNAVNYYQSVNNALDLESRRLSDQAKLIEDIVKRKLDLSTSSPSVPLEFKKDPPDWVFSSGDGAKTSPDFKDFSSGDAVVDFVLPSNTHDNNNPPGWIFSPPESVTQYKLNSKIADESDKEKFSKWMIPGGNIYPLNDLQLEAELVDNAKDYEAQFNGEKNTVLFYNDDNERASIGEENRPYSKSNHQTSSLSKPGESQLDREELLHKREERFINLRNLRNFIMKKYVSSNNNRLVTEKNKRRSVTKGSNIKVNNTKEGLNHKSGVVLTKIDNCTPSVNHTHSFSPVSKDYLSIKLNKTICSVKNSTNNKWNKIGMKSEPTLASKDLKSNHTLRFVNSSEMLKSFVTNQSEKPNYKAFVLINNRDYPKISSVEGSSIEQLLKASDDTRKLNLSDESYVILRSKELQRMKNVLLDNFKQMIVNSEKKSSDTDTSTCYYPWELSTVETVSTVSTPESTSEGCIENGQSLSTSEGIEVVTVSVTNSQEADSTSTNPQDTSPFPPSQPTSSQDEQDNSKQSQPFADLSSSTESQISPGTTRQQPDQSLPSINDLNDSNNNNKVADNLNCQVQDSFTEGLYFLMPAQSVNAIKCALENSRKIYMGSSITGKFIASIESPNMAAKEKFSNNPLSMNFNSSNDTILQQTIEHILRNKKNGEAELRQLQGFINKGQNAVKESVKKGEIIK